MPVCVHNVHNPTATPLNTAFHSRVRCSCHSVHLPSLAALPVESRDVAMPQHCQLLHFCCSLSLLSVPGVKG